MSEEDLPKTLLEAIRYFSDRDVCVEFVAELRWPNGPVCPKCGCVEYSYLKTRRVWKCKACKKQYSVKVGTIFEDSPLGLDKWLPAIWLAANSKNGISSHELGRALGTTQKSAWFMLHRIRLAMQMRSLDRLDGEVEVDETFIGGKARNMHKDIRQRRISGTGGKEKTVVVGVKQRGGEMRAAVLPDTRSATLEGHVADQAQAGSIVYTDAFRSYTGLHREFAHETADDAERYVDGRVHTNCAENFWSLLKRGLKGSYLDERVFAFNERDLTDLGRFRAGC